MTVIAFLSCALIVTGFLVSLVKMFSSKTRYILDSPVVKISLVSLVIGGILLFMSIKTGVS